LSPNSKKGRQLLKKLKDSVHYVGIDDESKLEGSLEVDEPDD